MATYEYQYGNNIGSYSLVVPSYQKHGAPPPPFAYANMQTWNKEKIENENEKNS